MAILYIFIGLASMLSFAIGDFLLLSARAEDLKISLYQIGEIDQTTQTTGPIMFEMLTKLIKYQSIVKEFSRNKM